MSRFDVNLLDVDQLFQKLLSDIAPTGVDVAADLDVGSFASIPFVTHYALATQDANAYGLWSVILTIHVFVEPATGWTEVVVPLYRDIYAWQHPSQGIVPGVGAIESLDQEISAFSRVGGEAQMENKSVVQYTGSWQFTARNH